MKLVIVESPNKCATISSYLGSEYTVMASKGNIRDLATCGKDGLGIDVENEFKATYKVDPKKVITVKQLTKAAKSAEEVLLATDPDREGEAISWHLSQVLKLDPKDTKRLLFHEITGPAIKEAIENPTLINMDLVDSQETRRIYDRVIGFKLSKLLQKKIKCKSAGRVQSATLKMLVDNDKARNNFVPEEYWEILLNIDVNGSPLEVKLIKDNGENIKISNKEEADALVSRIGDSLTLDDIKVEVKHVSPKPAFITSTLNQEAFNKFHFSVATTTSVVQKLYEGLEIGGKHVALITYIRTDSTRISPVFYNEQAKPFITEKFGKEYMGPMRADKKSANAQDAHEAIRPTDIHFTPDDADKYLSPTESKLYRLIYERAVASLMAPKTVESSTAIFSSNGLTFSATGSKIIFPGYEKVMNLKDEESKELPALSKGSSYKIIETKPEQKFTQPPAAITEAKIVKLMESAGIGRPSTYASTISTLLKRGYIVSEKGTLKATDAGYKSIDFLETFFPEIVSANYTADMESKLDEIEDASETKLNALKDFYFPFCDKFGEVVKKAEEGYTPPKGTETEEEPVGICPKCGSPLVKRKSRYGSFVACSNFPKCDYIQKEEKVPAKETGEMCPICGKPLVERTSKGKTFVACSGFPKCKYIKGQEPKAYTQADYLGVCPQCGKGHLVKKFSKRGEFIACTNYPECKYHEYPSNKKSGKK